MKWKGETGIALVITLLVMTILFVMGTAFLSISSTETLIAINERNRVQAFHLAEAGVERAIAELNASEAYTGTTGEQSLGFGTYTTAVTNLGAAPGVVDPKQIVSMGYVPNGGVPNRAMAQVEVSVQRGSPFSWAAAGVDNLELQDGVVADSYDSANGPYDPDAPGSAATIVSNGNISVWANSTVNGDARAGGGISLGVGSQITGAVTTGSPSINLGTDIAYPACSPIVSGIDPPGAYNDVTCDLTVGAGATVTLDPGTYAFNKVTLDVNAKLNVNGPVIIYMTDQLYAKGGTEINAGAVSPRPENLLIFSSYSGIDGNGTDAMLFDVGGGKFYGGVYLRNGKVEFQTGGWKIFGALIAQKVEIQEDARLHYDLALARLSTPAGKFRPRAGTWREVFP